MTKEENQKINEKFNALYQELFDSSEDPKKTAKIQAKIDKLNEELMAITPPSPIIAIRESITDKLKRLGFEENEIKYLLK